MYRYYIGTWLKFVDENFQPQALSKRAATRRRVKSETVGAEPPPDTHAIVRRAMPPDSPTVAAAATEEHDSLSPASKEKMEEAARQRRAENRAGKLAKMNASKKKAADVRNTKKQRRADAARRNQKNRDAKASIRLAEPDGTTRVLRSVSHGQNQSHLTDRMRFVVRPGNNLESPPATGPGLYRKHCYNSEAFARLAHFPHGVVRRL